MKEMEKYYKRKNFWHDVQKGAFIGLILVLMFLALFFK